MKYRWLWLVCLLLCACSDGTIVPGEETSTSLEGREEPVGGPERASSEEEPRLEQDAGEAVVEAVAEVEGKADSSQPDLSGPWQVKLMTFNIRNGIASDGENHWNKRHPMVYDVIRNDAPDVLGLQEAWQFQMIAITDAVPVYACIGQSRDADTTLGEWSPLCYRKERWTPAKDEQGTFWLSDTPDTPGSKSWGNTLPRIVTWARLDEVGTGRSIYVYNTHYDHNSQDSRLMASKLIARRMQQRQNKAAPVIVMGDFNAGESNSAIRYLKGEKVNDEVSPLPLVDTFRALYPDAKKVGTFNSWTGQTSGSKIDYIFALPESQGMKVTAAAIVTTNVDGRYPSDHFPVTATVEMQAP